MERLILYFGIWFSLTNLIHAQKAVDYNTDAIQLAARISAKMNHSAEISTEHIHDFAFALRNISQSDAPFVRFILDTIQIHAAEISSTHSLVVYLNEEILHDFESKHDAQSVLMYLLPKFAYLYTLEAQHIVYKDGFYQLGIISSQPQNMHFIGNEISLDPQVFMVEIPVEAAAQKDIQIRSIGSGWLVHYHYHHQPCKSCLRQSCEWQFGVRKNGEVEFMGHYGELPQFILEANRD